jgi:hypothetical protein
MSEYEEEEYNVKGCDKRRSAPKFKLNKLNYGQLRNLRKKDNARKEKRKTRCETEARQS